MPQLEVYSLSGLDAATVLQVMQTLLTGVPNVRLATDPRTVRLRLALPSNTTRSRPRSQQMQQDSPQIAVMRLRNVDPAAAVFRSIRLFAGTDGQATARGPKVEAETTMHELIVRGTTREIEQIRDMLAQMGETDVASETMADNRSNVRLIPLTGRNARSVLGQIEQVWPTLTRTRFALLRLFEWANLPRASSAMFLPDGIVMQRRPSAVMPNPSAPAPEPGVGGDCPR